MASIVGLSKISMPRLERLDADSARELRNYLYQMQEQLEYILSNIDKHTDGIVVKKKRPAREGAERLGIYARWSFSFKAS